MCFAHFDAESNTYEYYIYMSKYASVHIKHSLSVYMYVLMSTIILTLPLPLPFAIGFALSSAACYEINDAPFRKVFITDY